MWRICAAVSNAVPSQPTRSRMLVHSRLRTSSSSGSRKVYHTRLVRSSRPRAAPRVPDVHDRHHRSVADQDIAGGCEIGMDHVRRLWRWWDVGAHEPQALDQGRHHGGVPREPGHGLAEKRLLRRLVEIRPGDSRFLTGGDPPGVRPVVVRLRGLAGLEFDDRHQLLNEGRGQLGRGSRVDEVHQMPHVSGRGPHSEPGRGGIAAPAHVLDHSLGSQRLVQVAGVRPGHCLEHCICPSGQLDAHGTPIDAAG